jgi:hypothetical protein
MKRRVLVWILTVPAVLAGIYFGWRWYTWDTVCSADAPDGSRRAVVRCHCVPTLADARYHYYLAFDPPVEFRVRPDGEFGLKGGPSAVKPDRVSDGWATTHFIGYLQGFDGVDDRGPSSIEWHGTRVVVRSREGIACEVELRE